MRNCFQTLLSISTCAAIAGVAEEDSYDDDEFEEYHPEEDGEVAEVLELALQTLQPLSQSHASDAFSDVFGSIASEDISFTDISSEFPGGFGGGEGDGDDVRRSSQYQVVDAVDNDQAGGVLKASTRQTLHRLTESPRLYEQSP